MTFPSAQAFLKALIITLVLSIIGYIVFKIIGTDASYTGFMSGLAIGAFLGAVFSAIQFKGPSKSGAEGPVKSIFVGNLAFKASQEDLRNLFAAYGEVKSVRIMTDRATRRPRGFGFVEMTEAGAKKAISALDGKEFMGRELRVNEGNERKPRDGE